MKTQNPNFEKVKTELYRLFTKGFDVELGVVLYRALSGDFSQSFRDNVKSLEKEFNVILDIADIRTAYTLIDICIEKGGNLPKWIKQKQFFIDYNKNNCLDLIKNELN